MSNLKIGDRVRFLNTVGGGIVRRIEGNGIIHVEDESGFEIPTLADEVVVVTEGATIVPKPGEKESIQDVLSSTSTVANKPRRRSVDGAGERLNVHLCYLLEEGGQLGKDDFEVYLINESNYDLMVLYTTGAGMAQETRFTGVIPFDSSEFIEAFSPKMLSDRQQTTIELIAFKEPGTLFRPKPAMTIDLKLNTSSFFKANAFRPNPFFDDPAILYTIVKADKILRQKKIDAEKLREEMLSQKSKGLQEVRQRQVRQPKLQKEEPLVIDLHIAELVDNVTGMTPKNMLDLQLKKVTEVMDAHQKEKHKGKKIIFIHGKGEGVLRKAVTDLITRKYPKCEWQDASFQKYGFGATQVTIG